MVVYNVFKFFSTNNTYFGSFEIVTFFFGGRWVETFTFERARRCVMNVSEKEITTKLTV